VLFSVVKGDPTDEELAAVIAVLSARPDAAPRVAAPSMSGWSAYWRTSRLPITPGPGAWRASGR
jgi:hypothetical protein